MHIVLKKLVGVVLLIQKKITARLVFLVNFEFMKLLSKNSNVDLDIYILEQINMSVS